MQGKYREGAGNGTGKIQSVQVKCREGAERVQGSIQGRYRVCRKGAGKGAGKVQRGGWTGYSTVQKVYRDSASILQGG